MQIRRVFKNNLFLYHLYMKYKDKIKSRPIRLRGGRIKYYLERNLGEDNELVIGKGSWADRLRISLKGSHNKIIIGNNVKFKSDCELFIAGNNCRIEIGSGSSFSSCLRVNAKEDNSFVQIGKDCMFSNHIMVRTDDSHFIYDLSTGERINKARSITIGDHVWIAAGVTILKGTKVGSGSVVGTKSVVTRDIPENCIAVGIPAKVVRDNVIWSAKELCEKLEG